MSKSAKPNRIAQGFMAHRMLREAPALPPAGPAIVPAAAANESIAVATPAPEPQALAPPRPQTQFLQQGEEAKLGRRKNKKIKGQIRGGRNSPDWPPAVEHMGAKVPQGFSQMVAELALNHRLHKWQVLVEAVDCFVKKHGPRAGAKDSS